MFGKFQLLSAMVLAWPFQNQRTAFRCTIAEAVILLENLEGDAKGCCFIFFPIGPIFLP